MKINLALNALIYITLSFFYMESRCCIKIDREVQDKIDLRVSQTHTSREVSIHEYFSV